MHPDNTKVFDAPYHGVDFTLKFLMANWLKITLQGACYLQGLGPGLPRAAALTAAPLSSRNEPARALRQALVPSF